MPPAGSPSPRRPLPRLTAAAAALAALLLGLVLAAPSAAAERPVARTAAAARVAVPALPAAQPVSEALQALRRRGFRVAVIATDGYPSARPGHAFVAAGLAVERRTARARNGRRTVRKRYVAVRPGSRLAAGTRIHVRVRQVRVASAPAGAPATPSPATASAPAADTGSATAAPPAAAPAASAAAAPAGPAVNAGGTPVVSGPPPAGLDTAPDVAAPPATSSGGTAGTPAAPQGTADPVPPTASPRPPASAPVAADLAAETARFLRDNTVHLPFMDGCTGFLVRDAGGRPIGAVSAIHCGLLPARAPRVTGADGRQYVVVRGPLEVRNGEDVSRMQAVATAESVTLPPATNRTHDLALITFADADADDAGDPARVRAAYQAMRLAPGDARPGRTVTLSAFPKAQPLNAGVMRRQVMSATVLGQAPVSTTSGRTIPTIWTATKANADGAICSYGASGGAAVTADLAPGTGTPVFRLLGVLSGYDDFRPAALNTVTAIAPSYDGAKVRVERQGQTGFDLTAADATCDYAHELPEAESAQTVRLVTSGADIPR